MSVPADVSRGIVLGMTFLAGMAAVPPSDIPPSTFWGAPSGGLQCGLGMLPPGSDSRVIDLRFTLKNVGSSTVIFTDGDLSNSASQLIDIDQSGKISRMWASNDGEDKRLGIPLKPGETTGETFSTSRNAVVGTSVTYSGALTPIGANASISLRCGPIDL